MFKMIQKYLEKRCRKDEALSRHYTAAKMAECVKYITDEARKLAQRQEQEGESKVMVQIADDEVYHMAEHWFLEFTPELEKPEIETVKALVNGELITPCPDQLDLFGEA